MKFTNAHTHNINPEKTETAIINIFAQDAFNFNFKNNFYYSVGLHPWHADKNINYNKLQNIIEKNKNIIAIGEIGLDKSINIDINLQTEIFIKQVEIANKLNIPIIIHCVKAINEIIKIKQQITPENMWIYHNFNKNTQTAELLIKNNFILSFGSDVFKNNNKITDTLKNINLNYILLETDDSNIHISKIYNKVSFIKNINKNEFHSIINKNFKNVFKT